MQTIPQHLHAYLWDVDISSLDTKKHKEFIIERALEYGDLESLKWVLEEYAPDTVVTILKNSRKISPRTGNFYAHYFDIDPKELVCIQKPFTTKQHRF